MGKLTKRQKQVTFVFAYLYRLSAPGFYRGPYSVTTGIYYDDEMYFNDAFGAHFPGHPTRPDPTLRHASRRLSALLKSMHDDGWLDRHQRTNEKMWYNDAAWSYAYSLPPWLFNEFKNKTTTPARACKKYLGWGR